MTYNAYSLLRGGLAAWIAAAGCATGSDDPVAPPVEELAAAPANRLVENPGFEAGAALAPWSSDPGVTLVAAPVHGGASAAQIVDGSTSAGASLRSAHLAVVPGEALTATAWMQRISGTGGQLYLEFWRADGARATATAASATSATTWQQLSVRAIAPDDAITATVLAYSALADVGTTVWDDVAVTALPPSQRRIPNAGMEEQRTGAGPTEWTVSAPGGSAVIAKGSAHGGNAALKLTDTSTAHEVSALSRTIPVAAGESITATAWANVLGGTGGTLYLEFRDAGGARLGTPPTVSVPAGTGWRPVSVTGTAPSGSAGLTIRLYSEQAKVGTTLWDDVSLRASSDTGYDPALAAAAPVLFIGDQRVESYAGASRVMHPGTKAGTGGIVLNGFSDWDANPRLSGSVLPGGPGFQMWYTTSGGTGYVVSSDGVTWSREGRTAPVTPRGVSGVVANPRFGAAGQPRYFLLRPGAATDLDRRHYYQEQSNDGLTWTPVSGAHPIPGWDVANVTYDPVIGRFVATTKQYPTDYAPPGVPPGPRTVWVSTSADFKTWTAPQLAFSADLLDDARIASGTGKHGNTPWSEVYGMAATRYGDQYLGTPWVFDIAYSPNRDNGDPGPDTGRSHIEVAASRDLVNWSRPNRDNLIAPGTSGQWDYGFEVAGTTLLNVQLPGGEWQSRFYYGSFAGEHGCDSAAISRGDCSVAQGNSRIGLVTWPTDRFESFHAAAGGGTVTTRPLAPAGGALAVNYDPGMAGSLTVEVLAADGTPIPGYTAADATPITANALSPGAAVSWAGKTALPAGQIRLRFHFTAGDLYAFTVN